DRNGGSPIARGGVGEDGGGRTRTRSEVKIPRAFPLAQHTLRSAGTPRTRAECVRGRCGRWQLPSRPACPLSRPLLRPSHRGSLFFRRTPFGMIVLSPNAKGGGYQNTIQL